jgi:uncharacterized protein YkwD
MTKYKYIILWLSILIFLFAAGCTSSLNTPATRQPNQGIGLPTPAPYSTPTPFAGSPISDLMTDAETPAQALTQTTILATSEQPTSTQTTAAETIEQMPSDQQPNSIESLNSVELSDCVDEAAFYADVTIPDGTRLAAGTSFRKIWQIRNTGSCTWSEGYSLVFASGDIMSAPLINPVPEVAPGEIVDITLDLVAPARGGEQTGNWEFQNSQGQRFGVGSGGSGYIWVQIQVEWSTAAGSQSSDVPSNAPFGSSGDCPVSQNTDFEYQILSLINTARLEQGLSPLILNTLLSNAALAHSLDMACHGFVDHTGSDGSTWYERIAIQGYANANSARENIYVGDPALGGTPEGTFSWWMNSQVHRDNILNSEVTEIGIGYVYNQGSAYGGYFTVVFARP